MAEFGSLIRRTREARGETGQHLAQRLGIAQSTLVRMEKGQLANLPDPTLFQGISSALGISPHAMLVASGYLPEGEAGLTDSPAIAALRPVLDEYDGDVDQLVRVIQGIIKL